MSTDYIEYEVGKVSNCCEAKMYSDMGICADCKEHCDSEPEEQEEA